MYVYAYVNVLWHGLRSIRVYWILVPVWAICVYIYTCIYICIHGFCILVRVWAICMYIYIPMYICILVHQYEPLLSRKKKTRHGLRSHMNRKKEKAFQNLEMAVSPIVFSALPLIQYLIYYRSDDGVSESGDGGFPDSH